MDKVFDILKSVRAVITNGHFVLTSGKHAAVYINKDTLYPHTKATSEVCRLFAEKVEGLNIEAVAGPALGGIILSQWTAYHLSQVRGQEIFAVYTEKTANGEQKFTRGYDKFIFGKKVLVVEDLTSTGASAKKVVDAVRAAGGEVAAVCVMVNRNPKAVNAELFGSPFFPLDTFEVQAFDQSDCPLCKSRIPINTDVGHGKKYLEQLNS